ncbi:MAG: enoyl-CoA hydratase/isomerase family protein [Dokdonella sp.]|uniref:enoyl-CoA hydratase/isomerase family protein n=1 Tax=Dokdonella sp. TaxID=2291710 RepID=UPI0032669F2A
MLDLIQHDDIHELRLARPPVNALDPQLVKLLREAVEASPGHGARALVLSGSPGMFSAGLDVPALMQLDRAAFRVFWGDFFGLCAALARAPIPVVAAITGHAPAGGAVLAIMCDYRIMARGAFKIGLNEVQVGLSVPECIQMALRRLVGTYRAERLMVEGAMLDAEQAHVVGLVDELVDTDLVVARAVIWLGELLGLPPQAMSATRRMARADLAEVFADPARLPVDEFLDGWFAPEAQRSLAALVARLKSRG